MNYYKPRFWCLDDKPILLNDWSARELTILSTTWFASWHGTHIINLSNYDVLSLWISYSCKATQKTIPKFQFSNFLHEAFDQIPVHWCKCDVNEHRCQQLRIKNLFCVANFTLSVTYVPLFNPFYCSYFVVEWISTKASMSLQNLEPVIHCHQSLSILH